MACSGRRFRETCRKRGLRGRLDGTRLAGLQRAGAHKTTRSCRPRPGQRVALHMSLEVLAERALNFPSDQQRAFVKCLILCRGGSFPPVRGLHFYPHVTPKKPKPPGSRVLSVSSTTTQAAGHKSGREGQVLRPKLSSLGSTPLQRRAEARRRTVPSLQPADSSGQAARPGRAIRRVATIGARTGAGGQACSRMGNRKQH